MKHPLAASLTLLLACTTESHVATTSSTDDAGTAGNPYARCGPYPDELFCPEGGLVEVIGDQPGACLCGVACASDADCPSPVTGTASAFCDGRQCLLGCDSTEECPDGMQCIASRGSCMWPLYAPIEPLGPPEYCGAPNQDPAVTWDGWIEAHTFGSGSDRVRIQIEADGAGGWTGYLIVGEGPNVETEPRTPDDCEFLCETEINESLLGNYVEEGFRYTLGNVDYSDVRLRFDVSWYEIFDDWCRAQTADAGWDRCIPNVPRRGENGRCYLLPSGEPEIEIACCRGMLCDFVCACDGSGCWAMNTAEAFDLFIDGDVASGTTPFGTGHLQRQ